MAKAKVTPRNKLMDYLARREHSEHELRTKLGKLFTPDEVDGAIEHGKQQGWLPSTEEAVHELSEKAAQALHDKKKGILYINAFLQNKGLPEVQVDANLELEKAVYLIKNKYKKEFKKEFGSNKTSASAMEQKIGQMTRFLTTRGFEEETVEKTLEQVFNDMA